MELLGIEIFIPLIKYERGRAREVSVAEKHIRGLKSIVDRFFYKPWRAIVGVLYTEVPIQV